MKEIRTNEDIMKAFAEKLRMYRRILGISQEELGEKIMYTGKAVSKWERGTVIPPATALIALADFFNTSLDDLLGVYTKPSYYLGIDGGGTKTAFCLADEEGNIIKSLRLGASNPFDLGFERATAILDKGIREVTQGYPRRRISMFAGLAGGGSGDMPQRLKAFFEGYGFYKATNGSDSKNIIAAGLGEEDGMAVIMGTGSSAFVQKDGQVHRVGGLGYLFSQGGCAYSIGNAAIRVCCCMEDGSGKKTAIRKYLLKKLGSPTVLEKLSYFYESGKSGIASFNGVVFDAYKEKQDAIAEEILRSNMESVAKLIAVGGGKNHLGGSKEKIKVILVGGLTNEYETLKPFLLESLAKLDNVEKYDIKVYEKDVVYGALLCAGLPKVEKNG